MAIQFREGVLMITGDTIKVHPGILNFKEWGLRWREPFWVAPKGFDARMLLAELDCNKHIAMDLRSTKRKIEQTQ